MQRNCIILGSGRSGTSMTAGVLRNAGYFMGEQLNPPNETNPKGQFESYEINRINEELLSQVTPKRPTNILGELLFRSRPVFGQRWLCRLPVDTSIPSPPRLENQIRLLTNRQPFCYKDPRFSYTLPAWRPFCRNVVFVCIFRHPGTVIASILNQCEKVVHLRNFSINANQAFEVWELMYSHILKRHYPEDGEWMFLHYNQFIDGTACDRLEKKLEANVDRDFPDRLLNHSKQQNNVPTRILALYAELCDLAGYKGKGELS